MSNERERERDGQTLSHNPPPSYMPRSGSVAHPLAILHQHRASAKKGYDEQSRAGRREGGNRKGRLFPFPFLPPPPPIAISILVRVRF